MNVHGEAAVDECTARDALVESISKRKEKLTIGCVAASQQLS